MKKEQILYYIKKTTEENNGIPLGEIKFYKETPIKKSDWYGKIWERWNDAIVEAGYSPNEFLKKAIPINDLLLELSKIILEKRKFPSPSELKFIHNNKKTIPAHTVIYEKLGRKTQMATAIAEFCKNKIEYKEVVIICENVINSEKKPFTNEDNNTDFEIGKVYLMKSGKYYKIGKANHVGQRNYSLGTKLPEKIEIIHEISTDDPFGIEKYWHNRFKEKRLKGEWFDLDNKDIQAFKRRKNFM
jgi:hypothetical protein